VRICGCLLGRSYVVILECEKVEDYDVYDEVEYKGGKDALDSRHDWKEPLTPKDCVNDGWVLLDKLVEDFRCVASRSHNWSKGNEDV